ncbi:MAG: amidohydrolase [Anaerolineae bacterium]|nr:MAG: amidohydrolase [Anaerolineae bacterium]
MSLLCTLLHNARIYTLDRHQPVVSALAIDAQGRIIAAGGEELRETFPFAQRQDMGKRVILPGLTDAHIHLMHYALNLQKVDVETSTKAEAIRRVAERANKTLAGEWILGHGWQQNDWGGDFPTATDLDAVVADKPVYLTAKSLHAGWANSAALQQAGIGPNTPDPANGKILRDEHGQPTGILLESAMTLIETKLPQPTTSQVADAIDSAQATLLAMGITGVHDFDYRPCFMALQQLDAEGRLKLRVLKNIPLALLDYAHGLGLRAGFGSDHLRIGMVKIFMDGALGPRTAAMFAPYLNEPENRGILNMDGEELFEHGRKAAEVGLGLTVHAIGDRAVHEVLNGLEHLRHYEHANHLPALRHRIEHVQIIHPNDTNRLAQLKVIASMQPIHATSDMFAADYYWGERARLAYAWKTQLLAGAILAFGSDAPVESPNPFLGLHAAVTRRRSDGAPGPQGWYPEERLTLHQALEAYTIGAAYAAGLETRRGKLTPGFDADLIVLEQDPFVCPAEELYTLRPSATMISGAWAWQP